MRLVSCIVCLLGLAALAPGAALAASVEGTWRTLDGTEITVEPCGSTYCGTLSWIVIPRSEAAICKSMAKDAFAALMLDTKNPDKSLQTRPLLGAPMMSIKPSKDPDAYSGTIYDATTGKTHDVLVWILNGKTLRLGGGCIGSMCVQTQDWPKVAERQDSPGFTCDGGV